MREAMHLIEQGVADPDTIERCMRNTWGTYLLLIGPMRNMDLWGLPLYAKVMERIFPELSSAKGPPPVLKRMIEAGATGAPAGKGWFEYAPGEGEQWERRMSELQWDMRALAEKYAQERVVV
jgi:3-hydroxyacyl-CoA dehydrogenase